MRIVSLSGEYSVLKCAPSRLVIASLINLSQSKVTLSWRIDLVEMIWLDHLASNLRIRVAVVYVFYLRSLCAGLKGSEPVPYVGL